MTGRTIGSRVITMVLATFAGGAVGLATFFFFEWSLPATIELAPLPPGEIVVQIDGAVNLPGVYRLATGARLAAAIDAAGGLRDDADVSRLNLAARIGDGEHIQIPAVIPASLGSTPESSSSDGLVNINSATLDDLVGLPGIGQVLAQRIIDYRDTFGPFTSIDQLDDVSGISSSLVDQLRPLVTVGG